MPPTHRSPPKCVPCQTSPDPGATGSCIRCAWAHMQRLDDAYREAFCAFFKCMFALGSEYDNATPPVDVADENKKELHGLWSERMRLRREWTRVRVVVANLEMEEKKSDLEEAEKGREGEEAEKKIDKGSEELEGHALAPWKRKVGAVEPLKPVKKMKMKEKNVSFAPGVFDAGVGRDRNVNFMARRSIAYQPGAYAGQEYIDKSGYYEYPEDFYRGKSGGESAAASGEYWPEYTSQRVADYSNYVTPAIVLTNEVGDTRTLVGATLPKRKQLPFVLTVDPSSQQAPELLVISPRIVSEVDKFLQRPKPKARKKMMKAVKVFIDEMGIERMLFWRNKELWILARQKGTKKAILKESWKNCLQIAQNPDAEGLKVWY